MYFTYCNEDEELKLCMITPMLADSCKESCPDEFEFVYI